WIRRLVYDVRVDCSMGTAIVSDCQNAGRSWYERECMLIYVHWAWVPSGITARGIVPHISCARCKPDVEGVEEDAVGVIWVNSDAGIVPVLRIIHATVSERAALSALHITPTRAAIRGGPGAELATFRIAATAVVIPNDGLCLGVNVICVTRRDCDVDAS